jgi:hypothetical protein
MKKPILLAVAIILTLLLLPVKPAFAGSASVSGTFGSDPTMPVVSINTPNCTSQGATQVRYHKHRFTVDVTGAYDLIIPQTGQSAGMLVSVYVMSSSFNPAAPFASCLAGANNGLAPGTPTTLNNVNLTAGTIYYAVPFDDTFGQVSNGPWTLTISGPGNVTFIDIIPINTNNIPGCGLNIPAGSVVGDAPAGAQVFSSPGNVAQGVVLNPGTYWVIGQDASQTYYKVVLACQFVWVRKDTMGPSYQAPQNGAALPTGIVQ